MNSGSETLVFWILIPLFVAIGIYLLWYMKRRKRMLLQFAKDNGFNIKQKHEEKLQERLDSCFSLEDPGLIRSFGQVSNIIEKGSVLFFQTVELLDLNPHAQAYSTHFNRIAALFETHKTLDEFFLLDKSMRPQHRLPTQKTSNPKIAEISRQIAKSCNASHTLSVTLRNGYGIIYFEPLVTGGESMQDIVSLSCIAANMQQEFTRSFNK